ncbi:MAG: hypothetical protein GKC07_04280 [Methanomicrobiales archaeon]|nr:hypothetical protein [Methanomicrobiales archaeon]
MKENFTTEEWDNLLNLPYAVSMTVMVAAPSVMGAWGETKAMIQEPSRLAAKSGSALVGLLIAELQDKSKNLIKEQQNRWKHDQAGYRTKTLESCRAAAAALSKVSPEEALAYKNWVLAIGLKVAEAAKEHGVAVSEPEKEALNEVSAALGIGV